MFILPLVPTLTFPPTPTPPETTNAPVADDVDVVALPTIRFPPKYASFAMPTPPAVVIAPVEVDVEVVIDMEARVPVETAVHQIDP
jgi:hypothetical protein